VVASTFLNALVPVSLFKNLEEMVLSVMMTGASKPVSRIAGSAGRRGMTSSRNLAMRVDACDQSWEHAALSLA
jgi:hypothetical protein